MGSLLLQGEVDRGGAAISLVLKTAEKWGGVFIRGKIFSGFKMQLKKSLMLKRHLLHVEEKERLKDCRKGVKMSSTSAVQGQQRPESPQAASLLAILWTYGKRSPSWFSSRQSGVQCTTVGSGELKTVRIQTLILGTGTSFALCLSKCINSPNYMKKFPELLTKQDSLTPTLEEIWRVLTPKQQSDRQRPIKVWQHAERAQLLRKGLLVLSEELARSHNASWKEWGSYFSLGF